MTTYQYDPVTLRLENIITHDSVIGQDIQDLSYTYDNVGNIVHIEDGVNTATQDFTYDALNRLKTAVGGSYAAKTYSYDTIGNLLTKDGLTYYYGENNDGPHMVSRLSDLTTFDYDANGNMIAMNDPTDSFEYIYDTENRLTEVKKNTKKVAEYDYDGGGGRVTKKDFSVIGGQGSPCFLEGTPVLMADGTYKPIEDVQKGDQVLAYDQTAMKTIASTVLDTFVHRDIKEHLVINDSLRVTAEHEFYSSGEFTPIGKLGIQDKLLSQMLDDVTIEKIERVKLNEPIEVYDFEVAGAHNYFVSIDASSAQNDSNSSLKSSNQQRATSNQTAVLVHNRNMIITPTITTFVGSLHQNVLTETTQMNTEFVFLGNQRIASIQNGETLFYIPDHLGGTNLLTDSDGNVKELIEYKPFGEFSKHEKYGTPEEVAHYYYTGQMKDDESGLYFYNARYYNAKLGRFITADTIVQDPGGNPQTLNRYSYTGNNPVNNVDPSGHFFFLGMIGWLVGFIAANWAAIATGAAIGAAIGGITAAATGGNILQGIVTGAISGAIFGGVGSYLEGAKTIGQLGKAIAHTMAGAVSGGINSVITGNDIAIGAITGAFSAGASKYLGGGGLGGALADKADDTFAGFTGNLVRRSIIGATIGGASAEIAGGSFADGAKNGAVSSAIGYAANDSLHGEGYLKGLWKKWSDFVAPDFNNQTSFGKHFWEGVRIDITTDRTLLDPSQRALQLQLQGAGLMVGGVALGGGGIMAANASAGTLGLGAISSAFSVTAAGAIDLISGSYGGQASFGQSMSSFSSNLPSGVSQFYDIRTFPPTP